MARKKIGVDLEEQKGDMTLSVKTSDKLCLQGPP